MTDPWIVAQTYEHLLLIHWPVAPEVLRPLIPPPLELRLHEGTAWVGHDVLRVERMHLRRLPPIPGFSSFPELTVRTFVSVDGEPGLYLLAFDTSRRLMTWTSRRFLGIDAHRIHASLTLHDDGLTFTSRRAGSGADVRFTARYRPRGAPFTPAEGSFEAFLTGGNHLITGRAGSASRSPYGHGPWTMQATDVELDHDDLPAAIGLPPPGRDRVAVYTRRQRSWMGWPRPVVAGSDQSG